jgi:hypothetical protein
MYGISYNEQASMVVAYLNSWLYHNACIENIISLLLTGIKPLSPSSVPAILLAEKSQPLRLTNLQIYFSESHQVFGPVAFKLMGVCP